VKVHQDARVLVSYLEPGHTVAHSVEEDRGVYVYFIDGMVAIDGESVRTGDAAMVTEEPSFTMTATQPSELILIDVPMQFELVGVWQR
jgi:redox-sensitive bicupin YhaK (pirin superfamily)